MKSVTCPECNTEWELNGDGEILEQSVCSYVDCPVMDGTQFVTKDDRPLDFHEQLEEEEYEPDFFDEVEDD